MGGYNYQVNFIPVKSSSIQFPFEIKDWTGDIPTTETASWYMVTTGDCYKTFSYSRNDAINILGLHSGFQWDKGEKVYIDFPIIGGYQPSGAAYVKCGKVGKAVEQTQDLQPKNWEDYPLMFRYFPRDEVDENGYVKKIFDGKRQTAAYLLLGVRSDDTDTEGVGTDAGSDTAGFSVIQKVNTNLIMMMSQYRGMPVSFPMPWHGGPHPSGTNFKS
jgi:hypothetical protein